MLLRRAVLVLMLAAGLTSMGFAQEVRKDAAPDELPTRLIKVLRTTNKAQTNRYVPRVYTINNANPYRLFRWINRTARIEEGAYHFFGKPEVEGDYDSVKSGKIVLVLPEYMLPGVDEMMKIIDREGLTSSAGEKFYYFRPEHRSVEDTGFTDLIDELTLASGAVRDDPEANMYLVYDAPSAVADLERFLPLIDVAPPQVVIEATVYEVFVDNESKLGLDFVSWKNGPGRNLFAVGLFGEHAEGGLGLPSHKLRREGSNAAFFLDVPSAFFDFLVVKGKARVLTAAKIAARNLIPATLVAGDTILYYHTRVGTAPIAGFRPVDVPLDPPGRDDDYHYYDDDTYSRFHFPDNRTVVGTQTARVLTGERTGVELAITPTIATSEINLKIDVAVVSHTGFDDQGAPILAERAVESEVRVRDGEEIVLGGYGREVFIERSDKVPVLGSLPWIGYLFGGDASTTQRRRVVIVLRPHVVPDFSAMNMPGSKIDAALIRSRALREKETAVPETSFGFDQWLLDTEN